MNKKSKYGICHYLMIVALASLFTSCISSKKVSYLQNLDQIQSSSMDSTVKFIEPIIHPDDILSISIITIDPSTSSVANQAASILANGSATKTQEISGFVVDKNGDVELALVGKIKVSGLTTYEAKERIREKASNIFKDPNVNVRFANFKVSVIGEVNKPAAYTLPNEKVSILDAISLAGDLTLFGKRENILVIRDNEGVKNFGRLNLNSSDIFKSPYFYLRQNDVVYVEPNKSKVAALNAPTRLTITTVISSISVIVLILTRIF